MKKTKCQGRAMSIPGGLAFGAAVSIGGTLLLSGILAYALEKGMVEMEKSGYFVMVILYTAAFLGALAAANQIKHRKGDMCLLSGGIFFMGLMGITALFFNAQYEAVGETAAVLLMGSLTALLICRKGNRKRRTGR